MKIRIKKLDERAVKPIRATDGAAGADLYMISDGDVYIAPGETYLAHTGLSFEIPDGYVGLVYARSGLAVKQGVAPANKVGVIDSDYRGEVMVALYNQCGETRRLESGERIAQIVIAPYLKTEFEYADELSDTVRGEKGFGSTGTK